jgi:mannose-6-phosphate isomerase
MTLFKLNNQPMRYAWGSKDLLPDFLGTAADGEPMAEIWFGTHQNSLTQVSDSNGGTLLDRVGELPFLVKYLAAETPLSIQAHPSKSRAEFMFAQGHPDYQDANHKPELIIALTEFRALCGFRPLAEIESDLELLAGATIHLAGLWGAFESAGLQGAMQWIYDSEEKVVGQLVANAPVLGRKRARLIEELFELYPGDKGILVSVLLNLVSLEPGEALFLPAGNIHAYLFGLGLEVMAASDNVVRGGLTKKSVDVRELLKIVDYSETLEPRLQQKKISQGLSKFSADVTDFSVYRLEPSANNLLIDLELKGRAIVVCVAGSITLSTSKDETLTLSHGEVGFMSDARLFSVSGSGTGYLTMG